MDKTDIFILAAILGLVFAVMQSSEANKEIRRYDDSRPDNNQKLPLHYAPFAELIVVIVLLVAALLFHLFGG